MFYWFVSAFHSSEEDEVLQQKLKNRLIWFCKKGSVIICGRVSDQNWELYGIQIEAVREFKENGQKAVGTAKVHGS